MSAYFGSIGYIAPSWERVDSSLGTEELLAMAENEELDYRKRIGAYYEVIGREDRETSVRILRYFINSPTIELQHFTHIYFFTLDRDKRLSAILDVQEQLEFAAVLAKQKGSALEVTACRARVALGDASVAGDIDDLFESCRDDPPPSLVRLRDLCRKTFDL